MRIAIPIHSFEPGGVERVALRLAERWQADGQQVMIVLGRDEGLGRREAPRLDYRTRPEPIPTSRWETIWMIWCLYHFLLEERVDVVFCPGNTYTVVCTLMRLLLGDRCPPVLVKISNDLDRPDIAWPFRPFYRLWLSVQGLFLDHFIALTEPMRPHVVKELGICKGKTSVIADPALTLAECDALRMQQARRCDGSCRFVSVGRLVAQKNHALLIEAFARHASPGDTLVMAGDGPERPALEYIIRKRGLQDRVFLTGHRHNVRALLRDCNVLVISSDYEGVPAAVVEALAQGLPIAATNCCASMDWLLQHGRFGISTVTGNAEALGLAMNSARHLAPPREAMAEFAAQFTLERAAGTYIDAMQRLLDERSDESFERLQRHVRLWLEHGV